MAGPRDIILEQNEKVLLATRPLFLWEPLVIVDVLCVLGAFVVAGVAPQLTVVFLILAVLLTIWLIVRWIPWSAKWFVLTDRRGVAPGGGFHPKQAAPPLARIPDAS